MSLFAAEHEAYRLALRGFVEARFAPLADEWEAQAILPRRVFAELGAAGFLGLRPDGARQTDFAYSVVLAEELPRSKMMGLALSVLAHTTFFAPLLSKLGTDQQKRDFLLPALRGEKIGALAVTEPAGGSDVVRAVHTTASERGDSWEISGEKKFITNGPIADFVLLLARTRVERGNHSLSLFVVPTDAPGFGAPITLRKLGMHTSPTGWLKLDRCLIPKDHLLGKLNLGFFYVTENLHQERLLGSASALAAAQMVLDSTVDYLRQRIAYERPLLQLQAVRHRISEIAAEIEMARRFTHSLCAAFQAGHIEAKEISMLKFKAAEIVQRSVEQCLQLHGGYGFLEENWISRVYRDVRVLSLGGGVSELMKDLVAAYLRL